MHIGRDTVIRIANLESYGNYVLSVNANGFDNLAWLLKKSAISVTAEPNQFKLIEIPVTVAAEVSGMVYIHLLKVLKIRSNLNCYNRNNIYMK